MSARLLATKAVLFVVWWAVSIVMLATGFDAPFVYVQVVVFPVLAWMNFDRYRRERSKETK